MGVISNSLVGGIGNHVVLRTKEENFSELKKLDFIYMNFSGWCTVFILCLVQPFMELWMGKDMVLPLDVVVLLCIYFYLMKIGDMRSIYSSTNGLWWEYRFWSIIEALMNIILNILLAKYFGLYGIITATIITIFGVNLLWGPYITFKNYFGKVRLNEFWIYQAIYFVVTVIVCVVTYSVCCRINFGETIEILCIRFVVCIVIPGILYFVIYSRTMYFKYAVNIIFNRKQV
jgi:O-antigen/teichoic acid export membrane protein